MLERKIRVLPDPAGVAIEAANLVVAAASRAISATGRFSIALSGGSTPKSLYELLASKTYSSAIDWPRVHVYFGDERCVGPDHPDSNYRMAREALFDHVPIPGDNVYRICGELDPEAAATDYGRLLKEQFGDDGLDLALLGMGDDGHTASLFPGTAALAETAHRCVKNYVPKLEAWRITLTAPFLNRSRQVVVLVAGGAKAGRIQEVLEGPHEPERLPIQLIAPERGEMLWIMDAAAAGMGE